MRPLRHPDDPSEGIAEFQGLYGTFHVSELLLQRIWLRGEFATTRARTTAGQALEVVHPGQWNRLAGPDFKRARLLLDGRPVTGDVEVHFHAGDWRRHGHDADPHYAEVALHVVLFPPEPGEPPIVTSTGREAPTLVLVDLLWHDLEEYAAEESLNALNGRDPWPVLEALLALAPEARAARLEEAMRRRWAEKTGFARLRIERLGWDEACHLTTLEILGYRANRGAMVRVASAFPLARWRAGRPSREELVEAAADWWSRRGVRPLNRPEIRLDQYRDWLARVPDWPERLRTIAPPAAADASAHGEVRAVRSRLGLGSWRSGVARTVCSDAIGGARLDTWFINLALPFRAALEPSSWTATAWCAWWPGDVPDRIRTGVRHLAVRETEPAANGPVQALLALQMEAQGLQSEAADPGTGHRA